MPDGESAGPLAAGTETAIRRDLAATIRLMAHFGTDDGIDTHISARLPEDGSAGAAAPQSADPILEIDGEDRRHTANGDGPVDATGTIVASTRAYVNALNKLLVRREQSAPAERISAAQ